MSVVLAVLLVAGVSSGQGGQLSRSIGEVVGDEADSGRLAVEPEDLVDTEGSLSAMSSVPDAIAFSEPAAPTSGRGVAEPAIDSPDPDAEASSVAGGVITPTPPPAEAADPLVPQQPSAPPNEPAEDLAPPDPAPAAVDSGASDEAGPSEPATGPAAPTTAGEVPGDAHIVGIDGRIRGGEHDGRSFGDAVRDADPGEHFLFESGTHAPIHVNGAHGTNEAPIVIRAADPSAPPRFTSGSYESSAGLFVSDSSHLAFRDLEVRRSLWGVLIERSTGVSLERLDVRDLGQEGIRVAQRSEWVTIRDSTIANTGRRPGRNGSGQEYSNFGEGIYLGTGSTEDDPVRHVMISGNDIFGTGTEAIDIKAPVTDVTIRDNRIHDIDTGTSGAIVVHLASDESAVNPGIRIESNEIWNITTRTQWRDGVGIVAGSSVDVLNNTFRNVEHYGIRVEDGGAQGSNITARIEGNSFSGIGLEALWLVAGRATLQLSGNSGLS